MHRLYGVKGVDNWTWSYASLETQIMQGMCSSVTHGIMQGILHVKLTSILIQNC